MDNQDKIFDKIKNAAHKAEEKDFPGMERIWQRVDAKLEQKELQTKTKTWRKLAIAASVVLFISLSYQFLKPIENNTTNNIEIVSNTTTEKEKKAIIITNPKIDTAKIASVLDKNKKTAAATKTQAQPSLVTAEETTSIAGDKVVEAEKIKAEKEAVMKNKTVFRNQIFDALEVNTKYEKVAQKDSVFPNKTAASDAPLVVVNGKATSAKYKSVQEAKRRIPKEIDGEEVESLVVLDEPLYIINGVEYSEESLFGTHPTSPYAPLSKQNIENLEIFQEEEAVEKFGKKGRKGVVIITTKNGKPIQK